METDMKITFYPIMGSSIMPTTLPEANGMDCFRALNRHPELGEVGRKAEQVMERSDEPANNQPKPRQERSLSMQGPSLTPRGL